MQAALDRQGGLIVQQADEPVLLLENQLAGKKNTVGEFLVHLFGESGDVPARIVWTRFCNSGRLSDGISLTDAH